MSACIALFVFDRTIIMWVSIGQLWVLSLLYGSTTVVMATHGLHRKWQSLTPCQRHPSEQIEKIFGTIDYVIDLNNLAKFGFGKIFWVGGTYTQHIKGSSFFYIYLF